MNGRRIQIEQLTLNDQVPGSTTPRIGRCQIAKYRDGIYAGKDPREVPAYGLAEVARYVRLPVATLRSWVVGRSYTTSRGSRRFERLIAPASAKGPTLSFMNLIEAHVLRALRAEHSVSIRDVRAAVKFAEGELGIDRLFLRKELRTDGKDLLLDKYGQLMSLSKSGQLVMRTVFEAYLKRIEWNRNEFPVRLYPFVTVGSDEGRPTIAVDPAIAFGRPVVVSRGVTTGAIAQRIDAGETVAELAEDYDLSPDDIEKAVLLERVA